MDIGLIIHAIFTAIRWLVIARIILSFLPLFLRIDPYHPIIRFVHESTEPLMAPFRRLIPPIGGFDLSPIVLFLVLQVVEELILQVVFRFLV